MLVDDQVNGLSARIASLTPAQMAVAEIISLDQPYKVVAHKLGVSEATVKAHVVAIKQKLNVYSHIGIALAMVGVDASYPVTKEKMSNLHKKQEAA